MDRTEYAIRLAVSLRTLTAEQGTKMLLDIQDLYDGIPKAIQLLQDRHDAGGWLQEWLIRHPDFVNAHLQGKWPEWLSQPVEHLHERQ